MSYDAHNIYRTLPSVFMYSRCNCVFVAAPNINYMYISFMLADAMFLDSLVCAE